MNTVGAVCQFLDNIFPGMLAESWDNTGLLIGDPRRMAQSVMCCLTLSTRTIEEAVGRQAEMIVSHHPLPFRPVSRITTDTTSGTAMLRIIQAGISVYSPHTRFDSATFGINELLMRRIGIAESTPLVELARDLEGIQGSGRIGELPGPGSWAEFVDRIKQSMGLGSLRGVAPCRESIRRIAVACGSGAALLPAALERGCDVFVTGEANYHCCMECESQGIGLVLLGHYQSERLGIEELAVRIQQEFSDLEVWASEREGDPIRTW